jgi:hypothetical protein
MSGFEPRELPVTYGGEPPMLLDLTNDKGNTKEENNSYVVIK